MYQAYFIFLWFHLSCSAFTILTSSTWTVDNIMQTWLDQNLISCFYLLPHTCSTWECKGVGTMHGHFLAIGDINQWIHSTPSHLSLLERLYKQALYMAFYAKSPKYRYIFYRQRQLADKWFLYCPFLSSHTSIFSSPDMWNCTISWSSST